MSTATTGSVELGGYYAVFEEVLAWLLEAEERLAEAPAPESDDLARLKEHFHSHEKFLLELSEQQCRVGAVLEEGARLVLEAGLTRDEAAEVRLQLRLLNTRWEHLRTHAMRTQAHVHHALMRAQQEVRPARGTPERPARALTADGVCVCAARGAVPRVADAHGGPHVAAGRRRRAGGGAAARRGGAARRAAAPAAARGRARRLRHRRGRRRRARRRSVRERTSRFPYAPSFLLCLKSKSGGHHARIAMQTYR